MPVPFRGEPAPQNADTEGVAAWAMRQLANIASALAVPSVKDWGTVSANFTFDPNDAKKHKITLGASITLTFVTAQIPDETRVRLYITQDGTGSRLVSSWTGVTWVSGITPTLQTAAASLDIIELTYKLVPGGTSTWLGRQIAKNINANTTGNSTTSTTADKVGHSLTAGAHLAGGPFDGSGNVTLTTDGTAANTASTLVLRDASSRTALDGVQFPATQSASADANCLDDYEEGTFTPTIGTGLTTITYTTQVGSYTKIGRAVLFFLEIVTSAATRNASQLRIDGLPFTPGGNSTAAPGQPVNIVGAGVPLPVAAIFATLAQAYFYKTDGNAFLGNDLVSGAIEIRLSGFYRV